MQLSPPACSHNTAGVKPAAFLSQQVGNLIGGATSGLAWVELLRLLVGQLRLPNRDLGSRQWVERLGLLHRVLTALFYSVSQLLAQWHMAAAAVSEIANVTNACDWGSRSMLLRQIAAVLHLTELPHIYYGT
jgi:hypothetical protein